MLLFPIGQEHFLDSTVHPSSTSFSVMSCKTPWKCCPQSLSHSSPPVHSETHSSCFTLTVSQKLYLPKSKVTSVIQIQRSAEAFYLAHQLGLTWLTAVSSTLNLASRILSLLGFPPTLPAAPPLSLYLICPLLPIFFSCWSTLGSVVGPLRSFYSPHSWRSQPVSWPEKYHLKG